MFLLFLKIKELHHYFHPKNYHLILSFEIDYYLYQLILPTVSFLPKIESQFLPSFFAYFTFISIARKFCQLLHLLSIETLHRSEQSLNQPRKIKMSCLESYHQNAQFSNHMIFNLVSLHKQSLSDRIIQDLRQEFVFHQWWIHYHLKQSYLLIQNHQQPMLASHIRNRFYEEYLPSFFDLVDHFYHQQTLLKSQIKNSFLFAFYLLLFSIL